MTPFEPTDSPNYAAAFAAAQGDTVGTDIRTFYGNVFRQGGRWQMTTAMSMQDVVNHTEINSPDGDDDIHEFANRPIIEPHLRDLIEYLEGVPKYVLPSVTVNIVFVTPPQVYAGGSANLRLCALNLRNDFRFHVTDGQHRILAIKAAIQRRPELAKEGIGVNILFENSLADAQQMFSDMSQSRPIPLSTIAPYNRRSPITQLALAVIGQVPFFQNILDSGGKVHPKSLKIFTTVQAHTAITEMMYGKTAPKQEVVEENLARVGMETWAEGIASFYNTFTKQNKVWASIAQGKTTQEIPNIRGKYIHLHPQGLRLISRLGAAMITMPPKERDAAIRRLAELDYSRDAEIWYTYSMVNAQGQVTGSVGTLDHAADFIRPKVLTGKD
jgi:DNA sulfur modification protein DndB